MNRPSGAHSYALTPVGAEVTSVVAPVSGFTVITCGPVGVATNSDIDLPSGSHRRRGAGRAGVKIRCDSASRFGGPPVDAITNSDGSCALRSSDGVDTV